MQKTDKDFYLEDIVEKTRENRQAALLTGQEMNYIKFLTEQYTPPNIKQKDFFWELMNDHFDTYNLLKTSLGEIKAKKQCLIQSTTEAAIKYYDAVINK